MARTRSIRLAPIAAPLALALCLGASAHAGEVDVPHTFVAGDKARASEVNENFSALEAAVDDNAAEIQALQSADAALSSSVAATAAGVAALESANAGMQAGIAANAADIGALHAADGGLQSQIDANATHIANMSSMSGPLVFVSRDMNAAGTFVLGDQELNALVISVPSDGFLLVSGQVFVNNQDANKDFWVDVSPVLDGRNPLAPAPFAARHYFPADNTADDQATVAFSVAFPVTAGMHDLAMSVEPTNDTAYWFYNSQFLTAVFFPGPASASLPLPARSTPDGDPGVDVYGNPIGTQD